MKAGSFYMFESDMDDFVCCFVSPYEAFSTLTKISVVQEQRFILKLSFLIEALTCILLMRNFENCHIQKE